MQGGSQVAERHGIPWVNGESTSPKLTTRGFKWFFRTTPHDGEFTQLMFEFMNAFMAAVRDVGGVVIGPTLDLAPADRLRGRQPPADVGVGDDVRVLAEDLVAAGVVRVDVGVDDEADGRVLDPADRRLDPRRSRRTAP